MPFDLHLDTAEVQLKVGMLCFNCHVQMVPIGKDKNGRLCFECPRCHMLYHEDEY